MSDMAASREFCAGMMAAYHNVDVVLEEHANGEQTLRAVREWVRRQEQRHRDMADRANAERLERVTPDAHRCGV